MSDAKKRSVLVLCTGNSARSQMLEAILRDRLGDRIEVASAGTDPAPRVHPLALHALAEIGIAHEGARPKRIDELADREFEIAVTVCDNARETCPVLPGAPVKIHVGYADPAAAEGSEAERLGAFRAVRDSMVGWADLLAALLS
ncbi:MAG: arsenate reductase ArsC [Planctomycetota bacterium]|jgi:arsenate reductase